MMEGTCSVISDMKGEYLLEGDRGLYPGVYSYTASKQGYKDLKGTVVIKDNSDNSLPTLYMSGMGISYTGSIEGVVRDGRSSKAVDGMKVSLYKDDYVENKKPIAVASSEANGKFSFKRINTGSYTIVITDSSNQYIEKTFKVTVTANKINYMGCSIFKHPKKGPIKVVLTWSKGAKDLDARMRGTFGDVSEICDYDESHISNEYYDIRLNMDNYFGGGCEIITATPKSDCIFKYSVSVFMPKTVYDLSQTDAVVKVYTASGNEYEYKAPRFFRGYVWDVFEYDCANDMIKTLPVNTKEW